MRLRLFAQLAVAAGVLLIAFPTSTALADTGPPTLSGEQFFDPAPNVTATCDTGGTSTISFSSSGVATGPYSGTFKETGVATLGPQAFDVNGTPTGSLLTFDAVFTIQSPAGEVSGTKTLVLPITDPATQVAIGQCGTVGMEPQRQELVNVNAHFTVHYTAEISSAAGEFSDQGVDPLVFLNRVTVEDGRILDQQFFENFASDLVATQPLTSPGQATGGGQVPGNVTFGFTAKSDDKGVRGTCTLIDRATNTMVKCLDATAYFQTATHAVFRGNALVDGVATTYRISVDDNGEPGAGLDTFTISTGTGYGASGVLTQGNIQVHA